MQRQLDLRVRRPEAVGGIGERSAGEVDEERPLLARPRGGFAADMFKLVSGTALGQAATILAMPMITRLFSPDAFGVSVGFVSIGSVILVVVCLRYEQAIMLPRRDDTAAAVMLLSLLSAAALIAVAAAVVWFWGVHLLNWMGMDDLAPFTWLMVPWLAASAGLLILNEWNFRFRRFGLVAGGTIAASLTTNALCIGAGLTGHFTAGALVNATVVGALVALVIQVALTIKARKKPPSITLLDVVHVARRYSAQPLYNTWATLLNVVTWQLPIFMLTAFFSPAAAAQYALGSRVIQMPMTLVGGAIGKVFFQRAAQALHANRLAPLVEVTFSRLVALGLPVTLLLLLAGDNIFAWAFGAGWVEAGRYTQVLSLWGFLWFVTAPLSYLHIILGQQRFFFGWNVTNCVIRLLSLFIGGVSGSPLIAVVLFGVSGVFIYGFLLLYLLNLSGVRIGRCLVIVTSTVLCFLPIFAAALLCDAAGAPVWLEIFLQGALVVSYLLLVFRNERLVRQASSTLLCVVNCWLPGTRAG